MLLLQPTAQREQVERVRASGARRVIPVAEVAQMSFDAVIAPALGWGDLTLPFLREHPIPYVLVDRLQDLRVDQVGVENENSSAALVDHLLQLGHCRVGMVGGLKGLSTSEERRAGFLLAHCRHGLEADPRLMVEGLSTS